MPQAIVTDAHTYGHNLYVEVVIDEPGEGPTPYRTVVYTRDVMGDPLSRAQLVQLARQQIAAQRRLIRAARVKLDIEGSVLDIAE